MSSWKVGDRALVVKCVHAESIGWTGTIEGVTDDDDPKLRVNIDRNCFEKLRSDLVEWVIDDTAEHFQKIDESDMPMFRKIVIEPCIGPSRRQVGQVLYLSKVTKAEAYNYAGITIESLEVLAGSEYEEGVAPYLLSRVRLVRGLDRSLLPDLPFELGKSKLRIAKPNGEHQRFDCFPMRIDKGVLICWIQNERSGWEEANWNLEHTIAGIKSGFYLVEASTPKQT